VDDGDDDGAMEGREIENGMIEGMVEIEGDNDGRVAIGRIGGEGTMVKLGEVVSAIEGRGVVEGITVGDDEDDDGSMERREIEDGTVRTDGVVVMVGGGVVEGIDVIDGSDEGVIEDGMVLTDGDAVKRERGVMEGMVVIKGDNDGGVPLGKLVLKAWQSSLGRLSMV
jgi:hypothetical protein